MVKINNIQLPDVVDVCEFSSDSSSDSFVLLNNVVKWVHVRFCLRRREEEQPKKNTTGISHHHRELNRQRKLRAFNSV